MTEQRESFAGFEASNSVDIPLTVLHNPDLSHGAVRAFAVIFNFAGENLPVSLYEPLIAEKLSVERQEARILLKELREAGLVSIPVWLVEQ